MVSLRLLALVLAATLGVAASAGAAPVTMLDFDYDRPANIVGATQAGVVVPTTPAASLRP